MSASGGSLTTHTHPLGPNHDLPLIGTTRGQAAHGVYAINNGQPSAITGDDIRFSGTMKELVHYMPIHFNDGSAATQQLSKGWMETVRDMNNLQAGTTPDGPAPVLNMIDTLFDTQIGGFHTDGDNNLFDYAAFSARIKTNWHAFRANYDLAVTGGSASTLPNPWGAVQPSLHSHRARSDPRFQLLGHRTDTADIEFCIQDGSDFELRQSAATTTTFNTGYHDAYVTMSPGETLGNSWVGIEKERGGSVTAEMSQSPYQVEAFSLNSLVNKVHHVSPESDLPVLAPDVTYVFYIPFVTGALSYEYSMSNNPEHWTLDFMRKPHLFPAADYLRMGDANGDYWVLQKSYDLNGCTRVGAIWNKVSENSATPFFSSTFSSGASSVVRELVWSAPFSSNTVICEIERPPSLPSNVQILPIFVSKDIIHLSLQDMTMAGSTVGYDTVITLKYPPGRSLRLDLTHTVTVAASFGGTTHSITLTWALGPAKGDALITVQDIAGTGLINYYGAGVSSRDTLGSLASLTNGHTLEVKFGWLTRERAVHTVPSISLSVK